MPTKQQYLDKINAIKAKKPQLNGKDRELFEEINKQIPKGTDTKAWIKNAKAENQKRLDKIEPDYKKQLDVASDLCMKKKDGLIKKMTDAMQKVENDIKEEKGKSKPDSDKLFDLRHLAQIYDRSIDSLEKYQKGTSTQFSFGPVEWDLEMLDYEPYAEIKDQRDYFVRRNNELEAFADMKAEAEKGEAEYKADVNKMKNELDEKKTAFNSLNGWQKFWARVLPASWYGKAQDYADLKAQENAMKETGVIDKDGNVVEESVTEFVEEVKVVRSEGESLPEDISKDLQQKADLNAPNKDQEPEQKIHYNEREKTLDGDEYVDEYVFGEEMEP